MLARPPLNGRRGLLVRADSHLHHSINVMDPGKKRANLGIMLSLTNL